MRLLLSIICLCVIGTLQAQEFTGQAYYQSKTTVDLDGFGGPQMTDDMKKMIMERMKSYLEKTYILDFNKDESIYTEEEKLEAGQGNGGGFRMMMGSFAPGKQYKNFTTNKVLEENEFFGKEFLVSDTISQLEWKLTEESKMIGQYIAFKAIAVKDLSDVDFSFARRRGQNTDKDKAQDSAKVDTNKASEDDIEIPETVEITAWYTPQIPTKNGPGEYGGLPGLILEVNAYRTTILCSKIVMNPKDAKEIKAPTKGKKVTREEYNTIVKEKTEEMRSQRRGGGGGGRRIRIGG